MVLGSAREVAPVVSILTMRTIERRIFPLDRIEMRAAAEGSASIGLLAGHAAVFSRDSEEMWGVVEQIAPGCFASSIGRDDIRGLFNHNPDKILGRNVSKTLRLSEDNVGLAFELDLPDTQVGRDLLTSVKRGDITGCSFSFSTVKDEWDYKPDPIKRTLKEAIVYDVGPVTFPAYPDTDVSARDRRDLEELFKGARAKAEAERKVIAGSGPLGPLQARRRALDLVDV